MRQAERLSYLDGEMKTANDEYRAALARASEIPPGATYCSILTLSAEKLHEELSGILKLMVEPQTSAVLASIGP